MPAERQEGATTAPHFPWLDTLLGIVSGALPLAVAIFRIAPTPTWREDVALLHGPGLVPLSPLGIFGLGALPGSLGHGGGAVSAVLATALFFLPTGPVAFRAAATAAACAGASGVFLYVAARRVLVANVATPRLSSVLAAIAALTATLSPVWQSEANVAGGTTVAAAIALAALAVLLGAKPEDGAPARDPRPMFAVGALAGAALMESPVVFALTLVALVARFAVLAERPTRREATFFLASTAFVVAAFALGWLVRVPRDGALPDLLHGMRMASTARGAGAQTALGAWRHDVGPVALALAAGGAFVGMARKRLRFGAAPLVAWVLIDMTAFAPEPRTTVHLLATAALAVFAALSVQTAATMLLAARLPFTRAAAVLLVVFDLTLVTIAQEEASFASDRSSLAGAEAWTDEALERLPARTALLVRSRELLLHAWSARVLDGTRPDVLLVPLPDLAQGPVAARLLRKEPAIAPLVRDLSVNGQLTENGLTVLADARPAYAEVDPAWDKRVDSHLVADRFWMRFAPQPLGISDRRLAFAAARPPLARVLSAARPDAAARADDVADQPTLAVAAAFLRGEAMVAATLGDRDEAVRILEELSALASGDPFVTDLTQRLAAAKSGAIDVKHLLGNVP